MQVDEALTQRANDDSAIADHFDTNIHWVARPQGKPLPALVLQMVSEQRPQRLTGFEDMRTARVQADSFGATYADARTGIELAIAALLPAAELDGIVFWQGSVDGPRDLGELTDTGFVHRASADLIIRYAKI